MKKLLYFIVFLSLNMYSQNKYITKTGTVNFEASVPSFEEVKATNNTVTAIINTENGGFASLILVKGFRFKNALMEEHFNENYAESDTFPKATFKGNIDGFSMDDLKTKSSFKINGELTFHGKTIKINSVPLSIIDENNQIKILGDFTVKASDFDIKIPKVVRNKISEQIKITFDFSLKEKN